MLQSVRALSRRRIVRTTRDFLLGLGLFAIIMTGGSYLSGPSTNEPVPIFTTRANAAKPQPVALAKFDQTQSQPTLRANDERSAKIILALVFASLVAFNLGLLRHLRRVYASPR